MPISQSERHGLPGLQVVHDLPEDQLALAPGVAGVDHVVHVLARQQLLDGPDPLALARLGPVPELLRQDRKGVQGPTLVLLVDLFRGEQLEEMAHGEGDDVGVALEVAVVVLEVAEHRRDVAGHARLLGDDEGFGHRSPSPPGEIGKRPREGSHP
jgi:hypothetical protein